MLVLELLGCPFKNKISMTEEETLDFGRYILQLTNNIVKKKNRQKPLDEKSGEELLKYLYNKWKSNEEI